MLKERVITAIILVILFLAALFGLPAAGWSLLVLGVMVVGALEWARLAKLQGKAGYAYAALVTVLLLLTMWLDSGADIGAQNLNHLPWYCISVVLWVLVVPAWLIAGWQPKSAGFMGLVGLVLLIPTGLAMIDLRAVNPWLLLGVMSTVWLADIAAYFAGRRFGKNKLAPSISPGKTWEGVIGAIVVVTVYVLVILFSLDMLKQFRFFPGAIVAIWWWVGLSVIGDLFESAVKRQAGVKDSGTLLPGHGGLLDRIDALTSTLPFAAITLAFERMA